MMRFRLQSSGSLFASLTATEFPSVHEVWQPIYPWTRFIYYYNASKNVGGFLVRLVAPSLLLTSPSLLFLSFYGAVNLPSSSSGGSYIWGVPADKQELHTATISPLCPAACLGICYLCLLSDTLVMHSREQAVLTVPHRGSFLWVTQSFSCVHSVYPF